MKLRQQRGGAGPLTLDTDVKQGTRALTSPTNLTGLRSQPSRSEFATGPDAAARRGTPSQAALDAAVEREVEQLRFCSAMPVRHWIREADMRKREADQHHSADDIVMQYICLATCARILTELIPRQHSGYDALDVELKKRLRKNGLSIMNLVVLTQDQLDERRDEEAREREHAEPRGAEQPAGERRDAPERPRAAAREPSKPAARRDAGPERPSPAQGKAAPGAPVSPGPSSTAPSTPPAPRPDERAAAAPEKRGAPAPSSAAAAQPERSSMRTPKTETSTRKRVSFAKHVEKVPSRQPLGFLRRAKSTSTPPDVPSRPPPAAQLGGEVRRSEDRRSEDRRNEARAADARAAEGRAADARATDARAAEGRAADARAAGARAARRSTANYDSDDSDEAESADSRAGPKRPRRKLFSLPPRWRRQVPEQILGHWEAVGPSTDLRQAPRAAPRAARRPRRQADARPADAAKPAPSAAAVQPAPPAAPQPSPARPGPSAAPQPSPTRPGPSTAPQPSPSRPGPSKAPQPSPTRPGPLTAPSAASQPSAPTTVRSPPPVTSARPTLPPTSRPLSMGPGMLAPSAPRAAPKPRTPLSLLPGVQATSFTSSPLEPFTHSHAPLAPSTFSGSRAGAENQPARPLSWAGHSRGEPPAAAAPEAPPDSVETLTALVDNMSVHQRDQGYVPSTEARSRCAASLPEVEDVLGQRATGASAPGAASGAPDASIRASQLLSQRPRGPRGLADGGQRTVGIGASTEDGTPLRTMRISRALVAQFLELARPESERGVEACALLLGREEAGELVVTELLFPPQSGTDVSCTAAGEERVVEHQLAKSLVTLGWVHTHPTQSCFLSSLDLHTQAAYQALLPEAVAVVCALEHEPSLGVFRLTNPPGLQYVLQCKHRDLFHPHAQGESELPLYTDVATDAAFGHVRLDDGAPVEVCDLRETPAAAPAGT